ncbi:hypothetical protein [Sporosarcina sp. HYO08]|uniref:hypothetical protein n=1 Tax=Sporosarcina sp. HYO08 TaxID=1759557 RepID=UPI00079655CD|nr:hypothetical protein [Sporosarcina sp. HYO08]KXH79881.1 hypothetical protein AU377_10405 [Sporosarcina sp. HYO08]
MVNISIIWALIILFILYPGIAHDGAETGAYLFINALLPYLLPYIILTQWLLKMPTSQKRERKWKKYLKAYVLGSFGGFPVGAVTVTQMMKNGELTRKQSSLLLAACHAPGPMFIIGFIGTELFNSTSAGWKLLIAIHLANILFFLITLLFLFTSNDSGPTDVKLEPAKKSMPLLDALKESSSVIVLVATTVIFFSSLGNVLTTVATSAFSFDMGITKTITLAIFEMTSGVQSATDHFSSFFIYPYLIAAIVSLNGLSIHMQVFVIAKSANISIMPYIFGRMWSIALVPLLLYFIY